MSWPEQDRWRAPVGDWPPAWASAWGSDRFGLWADLVVGPATQRMRWIEPTGPEGFWMGSPQSERDAISNDDVREWANGHEDEPRAVVVDTGFWLADTPCTQAFWVAVEADKRNPSMFQKGPDAPQCPVEQVSWDDVQVWLAQLARQCPPTTDHAVLPTEVQWEYAARAGTRTAYWWGDEFDDAMANADSVGDKPGDGSMGATMRVTCYPPNSWGLYDVHGNVWEWCDDAWLDRLEGTGEAEPSRRALRGGSWINGPGNARSAFRSWGHRDSADRLLGFRLSLRSPAPGPQAPGAR
jgi:formylglycine-generating enzyme required for sulfatase activity